MIATNSIDTGISNLFDEVLELPSSTAKRRFEGLVGLDPIKERLLKQATLLLNPDHLREWSERFHGEVLAVVGRLRDRAPLILLAGDIGTGKTTLAETFADVIARQEKTQVRVMRLSLRSRGRGAAGEMTSTLGMAFDLVRDKARLGQMVVLVIDEADSLAQSRELEQMQHEDRAGVNALIRGIDNLVASRLPVLTVMCTNRLDAIDPAVRRRASDSFVLERPDESQRKAVLERVLAGAGLDDQELNDLARLTGDTHGLGYGYTYSDLVDRLIPSAVLAAYPDRPVTFPLLAEQLATVVASKPFGLVAD
jgi:AAA+ superfamily predicted ATPase